jgi:hypothetical protein
MYKIKTISVFSVCAPGEALQKRKGRTILISEFHKNKNSETLKVIIFK